MRMRRIYKIMRMLRVMRMIRLIKEKEAYVINPRRRIDCFYTHVTSAHGEHVPSPRERCPSTQACPWYLAQGHLGSETRLTLQIF